MKEDSRCFYSIAWIIFLIILVWPLAWAVAPFWIFLQPFEAFIPVCKFFCFCNEPEMLLCDGGANGARTAATMNSLTPHPRNISVRDVNAFLEKLLTWPRTFGEAIREGRGSFPTPS